MKYVILSLAILALPAAAEMTCTPGFNGSVVCTGTNVPPVTCTPGFNGSVVCN